MIYYRLLRDNKESGPYAEDEMIAKGFKPYDLLWAEGKSAGWQYPSEINAFKKYAPIVEEQPFDRFYKKQGNQKTETASSKNNNTVTLTDNSKNFSYTPDPVKEKDINQSPPAQPVTRPAYHFNVDNLSGRHIHVILPSGNTVNLTTLAAKKQTKENTDTATAYHTSVVENIVATTDKNTAEKKELIAGFESSHQVFTEKPFSVAPTAATLREKSVAAGDSPARKTLIMPAADFSWTLIAGAVIGIATLVGLGIMIGLSMNREKNEAVFNESLRGKTISTATVHNQVPAVVASTAIPVDVNTPSPEQHTTLSSKDKALVQHAVVKTGSADNDAARDEKKPAMPAKPESQNDKLLQKQDEPVQSVKQNIKTVTPPIVSIERSLSISENKFKTGAFGGISDLKCTLLNGSSFLLESVEVELDYIQANNKIYKTEKVFFKDIAAGAQITIDAPASTRGIKITSRIIKVNARDANTPNTTAKS